MSRYRQSAKLQHVRYDVRGANLVEAQRMEAAGEEVLKLNIGNMAPFGFEAPDAIMKAINSRLDEAQGYTDSRGIFEAREAVAQFYDRHDLSVHPDHIFVGNGVSELISMVVQALLNVGDEVLIPAPDYPLWTGAVTLAGGVPIHYAADEENGWNPDVDAMRALITDRTTALVIINPNNPTGAVYTRETLETMVGLAREFGLVVLADEIYEKVLFDDAVHHHSAHVAGEDVLCFSFSGLSKAYRACGFRAGWVAITGPLGDAASLLEGVTLLSNMRMCANGPAQFAIIAALSDEDSVADIIGLGGRLYIQRQTAYNCLSEIDGISVVNPRGALYLFPRIDPEVYRVDDDAQWALGLLQQKNVLVSHGTGFNWPRPDHFRLVMLPEVDVLADAIGRIGDYLQQCRW